MRVTISKSKNAEQVYITKAYRNEQGKSTSRIFTKLGTMATLLPQHGNDRNRVLEWAKEQARILTEQEKNNSLKVPVELSEGIRLKLSGLIYARILSPSSKYSSYEYLQNLVEAPTYGLHDLYRSLDVLNRESEFIQSELYLSNNNTFNTSVLYYDCTNFFFEIEDEDGFRKYGKSKEHRPNPIVQMGMFLDGDGVPLAFTVFPGNESEQPTLIPLEKRIMHDYALSKFIVCTDAGLASEVNRRFNDMGGSSFVVRQSLGNLKEYLKEWALDPAGWSFGKEIHDLRMIVSFRPNTGLIKEP